MKDKKLLAQSIQPPHQTPKPVVQSWHAIPWRVIEQDVRRSQQAISRASQSGDRRTMHTLQQQLLLSDAARLLAVRRAAEENDGKDTAGVDGVKSLTPNERLAMATSIDPAYWSQQKPQPVRRVWVPKPGTTEQRPLGILSMIDRCKQALVKLALEPEWEAKFESHSYGFRSERGAPDAIKAIQSAIKQQPCYVLDADIESAFDSVNHAALLDKLQTFPMLKQTISAWLTAGVMDGKAFLPSTTGIGQGGILSPLLMNIALHGLEAVVTGDTTPTSRKNLPLLVRYADDFVVLHSNLSELQQIAQRLRQWLATMGLQLNARKTRFTHTLTPYQGQAGFDFLGFTVRQYPREKTAATLPAFPALPAFQTILTPSEETSKRHLAVLNQRLLKLQTAPQAQVIRELNPIIAGWGAYYNGLVSATAMSRYDEHLDHLLMSWASKRHPNKSHDWLRTQYWKRTNKQILAFATPEGTHLHSYGSGMHQQETSGKETR